MTVEFVYMAFIIKSYASIFEFFTMINELGDCCEFIPNWDSICVIGSNVYIDGEMNDSKFGKMREYVESHPNIKIDHETMTEEYYDGSR